MKKSACPSRLQRSGAIFIKSVVSCQLSVVFIITFLFGLFILTLALPRQAHAQSACDQTAGNSQDTINQLNKCAIEKDIFDDKIFNLNQISGTTDSLYNLLTGRSQLHPETNQVTQNGGALASTG